MFVSTKKSAWKILRETSLQRAGEGHEAQRLRALDDAQFRRHSKRLAQIESEIQSLQNLPDKDTFLRHVFLKNEGVGLSPIQQSFISLPDTSHLPELETQRELLHQSLAWKRAHSAFFYRLPDVVKFVVQTSAVDFAEWLKIPQDLTCTFTGVLARAAIARYWDASLGDVEPRKNLTYLNAPVGGVRAPSRPGLRDPLVCRIPRSRDVLKIRPSLASLFKAWQKELGLPRGSFRPEALVAGRAADARNLSLVSPTTSRAAAKFLGFSPLPSHLASPSSAMASPELDVKRGPRSVDTPLREHEEVDMPASPFAFSAASTDSAAPDSSISDRDLRSFMEWKDELYRILQAANSQRHSDEMLRLEFLEELASEGPLALLDLQARTPCLFVPEVGVIALPNAPFESLHLAWQICILTMRYRTKMIEILTTSLAVNFQIPSEMAREPKMRRALHR